VRFEIRHKSGLNVKAAGVEEEGQFIVLGVVRRPFYVVTPPKRAPSALGEHLRSRHYHNEICVVPRLSAQTVIGDNE
jgi:hypothetical protein